MLKGAWLLNNRNLFLTVLEVERFMIKRLEDSVYGEDPFPHPQLLSWITSHGGSGKESLFIRTLIPFMKLLPYELTTSQCPISSYYILKLRV